jgi:hypothetical protein
MAKYPALLSHGANGDAGCNAFANFGSSAFSTGMSVMALFYTFKALAVALGGSFADDARVSSFVSINAANAATVGLSYANVGGNSSPVDLKSSFRSSLLVKESKPELMRGASAAMDTPMPFFTARNTMGIAGMSCGSTLFPAPLLLCSMPACVDAQGLKCTRLCF